MYFRILVIYIKKPLAPTKFDTLKIKLTNQVLLLTYLAKPVTTLFYVFT